MNRIFNTKEALIVVPASFLIMLRDNLDCRSSYADRHGWECDTGVRAEAESILGRHNGRGSAAKCTHGPGEG